MTDTYTLTKMDIAALRSANRLVIHYNSDHPDLNGAQAIQENRPTEKDPYAQDVNYCIPIPTVLRHSDGIFGRAASTTGVRAFAHIYLYPKNAKGNGGDTHYPSDTIIGLLKAGDRVRLYFDADGHNCGFIVGANMHADTLYLLVERGDPDKKPQRMHFVLDQTVCLNNTARMVQGVPVSDRYKEQRADVRKRHGYEYNLGHSDAEYTLT